MTVGRATALRRLAGRTLVVGGGCVLLLGGASWADGAAARSRARSAWEASEAERAVALARESVSGGLANGPRSPGTPVARLVIPSVGLDEIVVEGVGARELNAGPGHVPGTPLPGARGNSAISAHRDRHFDRLGGVRVGDLIETETGEARTSWRVVRIRVVAKDAPAIFPSRERRLTLTTCWPIRWFGAAPDRLIVTAEPADPR